MWILLSFNEEADGEGDGDGADDVTVGLQPFKRLAIGTAAKNFIISRRFI